MTGWPGVRLPYVDIFVRKGPQESEARILYDTLLV